MKKIADWIIRNVLIPFLKIILVEVLGQLVKFATELIREMIRNWKKEEEGSAESEEKKDNVRKKYEKRTEDIDNFEQKLTDEVSRIVEEALDNALNEKDKLLDKSDEPKQLPEGG